MVDTLPHILASLNFISLVLIVLAYFAIRKNEKARHQVFMKIALGVSVVFLILYAIYHAQVGHVPFEGKGWVRPVYFSLLFTHIAAAAVGAVVIAMVAFWALKSQFERHKPLARKALPLWVFICTSGLVVYVMAFHIYGNAI